MWHICNLFYGCRGIMKVQPKIIQYWVQPIPSQPDFWILVENQCRFFLVKHRSKPITFLDTRLIITVAFFKYFLNFFPLWKYVSDWKIWTKKTLEITSAQTMPFCPTPQLNKGQGINFLVSYKKKLLDAVSKISGRRMTTSVKSSLPRVYGGTVWPRS